MRAAFSQGPDQLHVQISRLTGFLYADILRLDKSLQPKHTWFFSSLNKVRDKPGLRTMVLKTMMYFYLLHKLQLCRLSLAAWCLI